jgi:transcriptional regulator with XRE-family HTH domain
MVVQSSYLTGRACGSGLLRISIFISLCAFARWTSGRVIMNDIRHPPRGLASRSHTPPHVPRAAGNCQKDQDHYIALIKAVAHERGLTQSDIAQGASLNQSSVSRYFSKKRTLDLEALTRLFTFLEIDRVRAMLAVEYFHDFSRYFERGLIIASVVARTLPNAIREGREDGGDDIILEAMRLLDDDTVRSFITKYMRQALLKGT